MERCATARQGADGNVFDADCPARAVLEVLAEKWALLLIHMLANGPARTAELRRRIGGISDKMLIQTLRRLERSGFVARHAFPEVPPRVEYELTSLGKSPLVDWGTTNWDSVKKAQSRFDSKSGRRGRPSECP